MFAVGWVAQYFPELVARLLRDTYTTLQKGRAFISAKAAAREALETGLIACTDRDVGAGQEVVKMELANRCRIFDQ